MSDRDLPNEPREWGAWDDRFARAKTHFETQIKGSTTSLDQACFDLVPIALPLYRAWGNTITGSHVEFRLRRALEKSGGDPAKGLLRALATDLPLYVRRHLNDYNTDMRSAILFLNWQIEHAGEPGGWDVELPVEDERLIAEHMRAESGVANVDPGTCIGILRDKWDRVKPKAPKMAEPAPDDTQPLAPTASAEANRILGVLTRAAKKAQSVEITPPAVPVADQLRRWHFFYVLDDDPSKAYPFTDEVVDYVGRSLLKR